MALNSAKIEQKEKFSFSSWINCLSGPVKSITDSTERGKVKYVSITTISDETCISSGLNEVSLIQQGQIQSSFQF